MARSSYRQPEDPESSTDHTPYVGLIVHYLGQGSSECMAAIITRICPPSPGTPHNDRCDLLVFTPLTPNPLGVTAEHDGNHGYSTWHHTHP